MMKYLLASLLLLGWGLSAQAVTKAELDSRIQVLTTKFEAMQAKSDKRIPAEQLRKAQGIILLQRTKAGFIFGYAGGGGVAMAKDPKSKRWSAPAFMHANEASLGFQIGGQQMFVVFLLMNTNATQALIDSKVDFGGEASGTAGDSTGKVEGTVNQDEHSVVVYSESSGLYGGVSIKGGDVSPDPEANVAYYGKSLTPKEILFEKKVAPSEAAAALAAKIVQASK